MLGPKIDLTHGFPKKKIIYITFYYSLLEIFPPWHEKNIILQLLKESSKFISLEKLHQFPGKIVNDISEEMCSLSLIYLYLSIWPPIKPRNNAYDGKTIVFVM